MSTKDKHIFDEIRKIQHLMNLGKNLEALNLLSELEKKYPDSPTVQFNKVGLLINNGSDLKDPGIVETGVKLGEKLLAEGRYKKNVTHLHYYNLANGYDSLYRLNWNNSKGLKQILHNEYLQKAKMYFRKALEEDDNLEFKLKKQLLTNYANCLLNLGRSLEALYLYDEVLKMDSTFGMALGNYAEAMMNFANISGAYRTTICIDAYHKFKTALKDQSLPQTGGLVAQENFKRKLKQIENWLNKNNVSLRKLPQHKRYKRKGLSDFEKFYLDICSANKLFLNFHIHDSTCNASIVDPISISITTHVEDNYTFYELSKNVNQIKEDFTTARLLLCQSQYERKDFNRISKRTDYVYALDYSMFNLYCGLLKSAFTQAYNILDKIALFINEYYGLGMNPTKISFMNIWKEKGALKTRILDSENLTLYALYDIYLDFECGETSEKLEKLPENLQPNDLSKYRISYEAPKQLLVLKGIMKEEEKDGLLKLSTETSYQEAIKRLFQRSRGYYKRIKDIRNTITHRRLVIFDSTCTNDSDKDLHKDNIGYETMLSETINLFKLVKSAIIYLVNAIEVEERKKRKEAKGPIVPMYADTEQILPFFRNRKKFHKSL